MPRSREKLENDHHFGFDRDAWRQYPARWRIATVSQNERG
jgi:hypothetical protein